MSWLSNLFGTTSARRELTQSNQASQGYLNQGFEQARGAINQGGVDARGAINNGYDASRSALAGLEPRLAGHLNQGYDAAGRHLASGYGGAETSINRGVTDANAQLEPFAAGGRRAQGLYDTAIGAGEGGAAAQRDFYSNYQSNDPFRAQRDEMANRQLQAQFNNQGLNGSGRMNLAVSRASLERGTQDLNQHLDRLQQAGAQGGQYASAQSRNTMQGGQDVASLRARAGEGQAGLETQRGSSLAGLGERIGGMQSQNEINRGLQLGGTFQSGGSALANLFSGQGQQSAANTINYGNAMAQTRTQPMQGLLGLIGTGIQGYAALQRPGGGAAMAAPRAPQPQGWQTSVTPAAGDQAMTYQQPQGYVPPQSGGMTYQQPQVYRQQQLQY